MPRSLLRTEPPSLASVRTAIRRDMHRYGIALVAFLAALAIRTLLSPFVGDRPLLVMFAAAVLLTAILAGLGPAIFATGLVLIYDTVLAIQSQELAPIDILGMVTFCFIALEIFWFAERSSASSSASAPTPTAYIGDILDALSHEGLVTDLNGRIVSAERSAPERAAIAGQSLEALLAGSGFSANGSAGAGRWLVRKEPRLAPLGEGRSPSLAIEVTEVRDAAGEGWLVWRLRSTADATPSSDNAGIRAPRAVSPIASRPFAPTPPGLNLLEDEIGRLGGLLATVSPRERQVLDGLVAGKSNREIGLALCISARTVERHRANIMAKMKAGSFSELIQMAVKIEIGSASGRATVGPPSG